MSNSVLSLVPGRLSTGAVRPVLRSQADSVVLRSVGAGGAWSAVRFWQSPAECWVLSGLPAESLAGVFAALGQAGCSVVSSGCSLRHPSVWVAFRGPRSVAASLYRSFPHPERWVVFGSGVVGGPGW